jgi:diguanylate cyclase (GGDEF)-like protein
LVAVSNVKSRDDARIRSLAVMARALGRSDSLLNLLEIAAEEARTALDASTASISRVEPGLMKIRTLLNVGQLGPDEERWPEDETYDLSYSPYLSLVLEEHRTWTASLDDPDSPEGEKDLLRRLGKASSLGSPVIVDGQLWGEFYATRPVGEDSFDDRDVAYIEALVAILSGSVSRALREESLERLVYLDPLTGLWNRRALDERAAEAFEVAPGASRTVTVVQVDINRLKQVNDSLGHNAGDQLIQSVASTLLAEFSHLPGSLVSRVGGDEFTALVVGHDPSAVISIADRLNRRSWRVGAQPGISCGCSSAVITADTTLTPSELFAAADQAQYHAKHSRPIAGLVADIATG